MGGWDTLARESLDVFDRVLGRVVQELANDLDSFIVADMDGGFVVVRFAM